MSHSALGLHPITLIRAQHRTQAPHLISTPWPFHAISAVLRLCPDNLEARAGITPYLPVLLALYFASSHQKEGHFSKQPFGMQVLQVLLLRNVSRRGEAAGQILNKQATTDRRTIVSCLNNVQGVE